jgi:trk system potassium uptake protein TrkH
LVSNVVLITLPTLFFCFADWGGALAHLDPADKLTNALFHATSLRTAGFNAVDLALLSEPSWSLSLLLMIIGGSPFSTAGGIKVTTVALALVAFLPTLRGERRSLLLDRAQSVTHGAKALSIFLLSFVIIGGALFLLQCLGEPLELNVMLFEVISALGTVGLSQGGTSALSGAGLMVIMLCMFLGRVGPPALLLSFTPSKRQGVNHDPDSYIEEDLPLS